MADEDGGTQDAVAVCEVSSFQAEQLGHFVADSLLWTNFAEDHLERHPGLEAYFAAKWELVLRTPPGKFLAGSSVARFAAQFGRPLPPGSLVETEGQPADPRLSRTPFSAYPSRENFILASAWWRSEGLEEAALYAAARSFKLGRHRISKVATIDGVTYWNDSKATNFHAVEAALAGFKEPVVLIAGGRSKGGDLSGFARRIAPRVRHAVLIGETGAALAAALEAVRRAARREHEPRGCGARRSWCRAPEGRRAAQPGIRELRHVPQLRGPWRPLRGGRRRASRGPSLI